MSTTSKIPTPNTMPKKISDTVSEAKKNAKYSIPSIEEIEKIEMEKINKEKQEDSSNE